MRKETAIFAAELQPYVRFLVVSVDLSISSSLFSLFPLFFITAFFFSLIFHKNPFTFSWVISMFWAVVFFFTPFLFHRLYTLP